LYRKGVKRSDPLQIPLFMFTRDKRGRKLYAHTYYNEPDRRWFLRTHTPAGLFMKKWVKKDPPVDSLMVKSRGRKRVRRTSSTRRSKSGPSRYKSVSKRSPSKGKDMVVWKKPYKRPYKQTARRAGKFKKPSRRSGRGLDKYHRNGVSMTEETTSSGTDANCLYIMAETVSAYRLVEYTIGALIRKLFGKAGIRIPGWDDNPYSIMMGSALAGDDTLAYQVNLIQKDVSTSGLSMFTAQSFTYNTLNKLVAFFVPEVLQWMSGYGLNNAGNDKELIGFTLTKAVSATGLPSTFMKLSEIAFDECVLEFSGNLNLKVQNRSTSATLGTDAEDVSATHVEGRLYTFNGIPKPKNNYNQVVAATAGAYKFSQFYVGNYGVEVFNPSNMDPTFAEPPPPSAFWNCKKSSKVNMGPGEIKNFFMKYHRRNINPIKLWKSIHYMTTDSGTNDFYTYNIMPTVMLAIEDVINLNGASEITLAFEAERKLSVLCNERRKQFMKPNFVQTSVASA